MKQKRKILISSSAKESIKESAKLASELGLGMEISRVPLYREENLTLQDTIDELKEEIKEFNGRITFHAMFSDVNVSSQDIVLRKISRQRCMESFEIGKAINADTILFHSGNKGTKHYGSIKQFKKNFIAFYKDFIKEFETAGITAVIENVFETEPDFCIELVEGVNSPNLKLALDAGHVNLYSHKTKVVEWIKKYGERLYHMHIHNNYGENDDHSNLNNGQVNYKEVFNELNESGLNPNIVLEMFSEDDIRKSLKLMSELNFFKPETI